LGILGDDFGDEKWALLVIPSLVKLGFVGVGLKGFAL